MADNTAPLLLIFSTIPGDSSAAIEFSGAPDDFRARIMAGMTAAEIAAEVVQALNAHGPALKALRAVRQACRDPDTDTAMPIATGELVEAALAAMGERS
ncbi:hypothetical protein [Methylorubrum extorquens]|uniref:hypothetical protein n=1 Tax=Methylorubrum extorquens TaxID=408 RepID=UPI0022390C3A|nr:hypothetical protein [Methylorubrum extorquens]UYW32475.1 hypothetical protein OKB92_26515 [Methylorubrum extorquens]